MLHLRGYMLVRPATTRRFTRFNFLSQIKEVKGVPVTEHKKQVKEHPEVPLVSEEETVKDIMESDFIKEVKNSRQQF